MRGLGKSGSEISFVLILSNIIALIIQGLIGYSNEKWGTHKTVTIYVLISSVISCGLFFFTGNWLFGTRVWFGERHHFGACAAVRCACGQQPLQIRPNSPLGNNRLCGRATDFRDHLRFCIPEIHFRALSCLLSLQASCSLYLLPKPEQPIDLSRACSRKAGGSFRRQYDSRTSSRTNCSSPICFWRSSFSARTQSTPVICRCF